MSVHRGGAWFGGGVCSQGVPGPRGSAPGGVPGPRGSAPGGGGAWFQGGAWSGGVGIPACTEADPQERWLLLQTVRILLECILVLYASSGSSLLSLKQ